MASIRKRNGKFQAVIRRPGFKTHSRTFHKKKDALEWVYEIELKEDRRGMPDNLKSLEKTTLSDLLIRYPRQVISFLHWNTKRTTGYEAKNDLFVDNLCGYLSGISNKNEKPEIPNLI